MSRLGNWSLGGLAYPQPPKRSTNSNMHDSAHMQGVLVSARVHGRNKGPFSGGSGAVELGLAGLRGQLRQAENRQDGCRGASFVRCACGLGTAGAPSMPDRCSGALRSVDLNRKRRIPVELVLIAMPVLDRVGSAA
jgi:hypothetical protein